MATTTKPRKNRKPRADKAERFDIYQTVTDEIVAALEAGTVPWKQPFTADNGLHRNLSSKRAYRGVNQWLLTITAMRNGYADPYWVTFKGAEKLGGKVRKGEKSTMVVFWKRILVKDDDTDEKRMIPILRYFRVFNVAQCDGLEIPAAEPREEFDPIAECDAIVENMPNRPEITYGHGRAAYAPTLDRIVMPARDAFTDATGYYATLLHELVHSTGHKDRLARRDAFGNGFGTEKYSREELTAEMGATMLCGIAGIAPAHIDQSAAYIAGWLKALKDDKRAVIVAAGKAHAAADYILGVTYENDTDDS
jgi:antirestriction protein ArdC